MSKHAHLDPFSPATELADRIRNGDVTPTEAVEAYLDRIHKRDTEINAYTSVNDAEARQAANDAEQTLEDGEDVGPLHGVPIALKDNGYRREGQAMPGVSEIIGDSDTVAEDSAPVVERLEDAGAIFLGRTNLPEFGMDYITDNDRYGATVSPINSEYNAGGSSGGSAAAVASGMAAVAMGSDMAGSIRVPAAACGIFGLKPSYGLIPAVKRPNAFSGTTHHVTYGPLTRTVADAAFVMEVVAGQHPRDPTSVPVDIDYLGAADRGVENLRVGYSSDLDAFPVADAVTTVTEAAAFDALGNAGATVKEVSVDHGLAMDDFDTTFQTSVGVAMAHANDVIEQSMDISLLEHADQMAASPRTFLEIGEETTRSEGAQADLVRTQFFDAIEDVFDEYDAMVTPTLSVPGFKARPDTTAVDRSDQALTHPFNWTGHPASSVPAGLTDEGLPVGLQVIAPRYDDDIVLALSAAIERERPWHAIYRK